jgi:hypothetical protein
MVTAIFSKMLLPVYKATKCHILEDGNLNIYYYENSRCYILAVSVFTIITELDGGEWSAACSDHQDTIAML